MRNKWLLVISVLILIVVLVFFVTKSRSENSQSTGSTKSVVAPNNFAAVNIGQKAPDFSLTTLDGQAFRLGGNKNKTVILFGMAGWCGTCIPEGRALTQIRKEYAGKGVEVIGVAFTKGDNEDFLKEFRKLGTIDIPLAVDTDNVGQKYTLTRLETTYIINTEGVIVYKDEEFTDYEDYKRELDKII